jgi:hypothetical protein
LIKIVIQTDADFTPPGKRRAKIAYGNRIRWYVGGRIYRTLKPTQENLNLSVEWMKSGAKKSGK